MKEKKVIYGAFAIFQALFICLKLCGVLTVSWTLVLFPLWGLASFLVLAFSICFLIAAVQTVIENKR